MTECRDF